VDSFFFYEKHMLRKLDMRSGTWSVRSMGGMDQIHLAPDRDQWRELVNIVMNVRVLLNVGKFMSS
jgi:hypothetical protein